VTDHRLSTRDLAARSDSDEPARALDSEQPAERTSSGRAAARRDSGFESAQPDASTRDQAAAHPSDTRETDSAAGDGGGHLGSSHGATRIQPAPGAGSDHEPLLASDQSERFTSRWQEIQTSFVDQPRDAVAEADTLVADLMQRLAASFSHERERLEAQWDRGDDVSTEDLRVALTRYRSFFDRLLSA
jgi:hypothetical protein